MAEIKLTFVRIPSERLPSHYYIAKLCSRLKGTIAGDVTGHNEISYLIVINVSGKTSAVQFVVLYCNVWLFKIIYAKLWQTKLLVCSILNTNCSCNCFFENILCLRKEWSGKINARIMPAAEFTWNSELRNSLVLCKTFCL